MHRLDGQYDGLRWLLVVLGVDYVVRGFLVRRGDDTAVRRDGGAKHRIRLRDGIGVQLAGLAQQRPAMLGQGVCVGLERDHVIGV